MPSTSAAGRTLPGKDWQQIIGSDGQMTDYAIYIDVDTSGHFITGAETPIYTVSLGGDSRMWDANGAQCVYDATETGFRVCLRSNFRDTKDEDVKLDVAFAQSHNWFINWHGTQNF